MPSGMEDAGMNERDINQRVAEEICNGFDSNGRQIRSGSCVALLDGKVVAVAEHLAAAVRALRALEPNPKRGMVFEVGPQVIDVVR